MNTKIIKFDINKNLYNTLIAKQGDTKSRFLLFNLLDGSIPFSLENRSVRVYAVKPDRTEVFNDLIITDAAKGYCILELTTQMLAVAGTVKLELMVIEEDKKLTSNIFYMDVKESINSEKAVVSTNEFGALLTALSSLNEYDNYKREIAAARDGEANLLTKVKKIDEQLEQNNLQQLSNVRLSENIELKEVLKYSVVGSGYTTIQSFCVTQDSIIVATIKSDDRGTRLLKFNKSTYELSLENTSYSYSHANDMCYNNQEDLIYIVHASENKISKVNPHTLQRVGEVSDLWAFGISREEENNSYILRINDKGKCKIRRVDDEFKTINEYDTNFEISSSFYVAQGVGSDENYIIEAYSRPETLVIYDKSGNMITTYSLDLPSPFEVETIKKVGLNTWHILVAEQGKNIIIYEVNLNKNNILSTSDYMKNKYNDTNFNLYVDKNYVGVSDGTLERPFSNLGFATRFLANFNGYKGYIGLNLLNESYDESLIIKDIDCYVTINGVSERTKVNSIFIDRVKTPLLVINNIEPVSTNSDDSHVYINGCIKVSLSNITINSDSSITKTGLKCVNSTIELGTNVVINNCLNAIQSSGASILYITASITGINNTYSILANNGCVYGGQRSTISGVMKFKYNSSCEARFVLASGTDLNTLKYKGKYAVLGTGQGGTMINLPITSNCIIDVDYVQTEDYLIQRVIGYNNGDIYNRFSTDGGLTWKEWWT